MWRVVARKGDKAKKLYFQLYDVEKFRNAPTNPDSFHYMECIDFLTLNHSKQLGEWEPKNGINEIIGQALIGRYVRLPFNVRGMQQWYTGKIVRFDIKKKRYGVEFEDNTNEDVKEDIVISNLLQDR